MSSNRGFTLVEMLIAMVIILVALLGLVQAALLSIDNNLRNLLRDEAVRLANEQMNVLKGLPINDNPYPNLSGDPGLMATTNKALSSVTRYFGTFPGKYVVHFTVTDLTSDHSRKSIQVFVGWSYKNEALLPQPNTGQEYEYTITSIVASAS